MNFPRYTIAKALVDIVLSQAADKRVGHVDGKRYSLFHGGWRLVSYSDVNHTAVARFSCDAQ